MKNVRQVDLVYICYNITTKFGRVYIYIIVINIRK